MNARWLAHLFSYKTLPQALFSAAKLIEVKVERENALLAQYQLPKVTPIIPTDSLQHILLAEARAAKHFWRLFKELLPNYPSFVGRVPHALDPVNRLLDLGYHQLTNLVRTILVEYNIPGDVALIHVAHKINSAPLAYDLVEMFRADIVDAEVLRYLRLKKNPLADIAGHEIAHFLHEVNERVAHHHYLKDFKICYAYRYYMELQILKFEKAVNHHEVFAPLHLPTRHEGRCP
jgi:CRISPR-associated endonuclease Cas1